MTKLWTRSAPRRSWVYAFIAMVYLISSLVAPAQAATVTPAPQTTAPAQETAA